MAGRLAELISGRSSDRQPRPGFSGTHSYPHPRSGSRNSTGPNPTMAAIAIISSSHPEREKQWPAYRDQVSEIRRMKQDIARTREQGRN